MKKLLKSSLNRLGYHLTHDHLATLPIPHHSSREGQLLLALAYQQLVADQRALPDFNDAGVRAFSQTNEDGILLLLQAVLGRGHSRVVELGSSTVTRVQIGAKASIYTGAGTPNGSQVGSPGDIYLNTSGGAATTLYVKESGANTNTGWVGK